jgi:hypothetical protein
MHAGLLPAMSLGRLGAEEGLLSIVLGAHKRRGHLEVAFAQRLVDGAHEGTVRDVCIGVLLLCSCHCGHESVCESATSLLVRHKAPACVAQRVVLSQAFG